MRVREALSVAGKLAMAALMCTCVGCRGFARAAPPQPEKKDIGLRRVAIVEFFDKSRYSGTAEQFTQALRDKLAERVTATDVIVVPQSMVAAASDPFAEGTIAIEALVKARSDYMADALIIGSVDAHHPYYPPSVHVSLKVIDTATAEVLFEVAEGWNAGHEYVCRAIDAYYRRNIGSDDCRFGPDLFLVSPRYFLKFVAATVAERLTDAL